jgi:hypothetical protein
MKIDAAMRATVEAKVNEASVFEQDVESERPSVERLSVDPTVQRPEPPSARKNSDSSSRRSRFIPIRLSPRC